MPKTKYHKNLLGTNFVQTCRQISIYNGMYQHNHISRITNTANKSLGFLRRNLRKQNTSIRENAYKAIVRPQLEYAAPVWDPHTKDDIHKIESVQR